MTSSCAVKIRDNQMLTHKNIEEVREYLERAQNPLFLFDNDVDGLSSFLLLRKFCGKGKGVAIKSFPELSVAYARKLHEFNPDYVFVLDKPLIENAFIDSANEINVPIIWVDHHPPPENSSAPGVHYFNPLLGEEASNEPTSYLCYKITKRKEDMWLAMIGCLSDWYLPEFSEDFAKEYPELFSMTKNPAKALYESELGKMIRILSFALKDRTSVVVKMLRNLLTIENPKELVDITSKTAAIHRRYKQINRKYEKILEKAKKIARDHDKRILFFQYSGELSLSSEIANELTYLFPEKIIAVAYIRGSKINVSIRGNINVRELVAESLKGIESTSGGHEHACGATLNVEDLPKFRDNLISLTRK